MTAPFVRFDHVSKSYDGKILVVDDIDLVVEKGEFLTMLGPSGSGKSTCLMMLAGFEDVNAGSIHIGGKQINHLPPYKRDIGMVFQNYALFPHMSVAENVGFPLKQRGVGKSEIAERSMRALDMVQLTSFKDRRPAQLSGGQQQRVALARAMVFEPQLILMDEPLGALDRRLREHMQIEIKNLHARIGTTIIYVTHDQSEALTMSNRVAVFNRGRIEQIASPRDIYDLPATPFVANFMGESNSLPGVVERIEESRCVVRLDGGSMAEVTMVDASKSGDRVSVSVRPEQMHLNADARNCINVEVDDLIFNGDHVIVSSRLQSGLRLQLKVPSIAMKACEIAPGAKLDVSFDVASARAFRA